MNKLPELLKSFRTATFKDTTIVFMGNNLSSVLGAVFFFILAHQAGPTVFGIFSIAIAVAITAVDLFDIAINNAIISFGSKSGWMAVALRHGLKRKLLLSTIFAILLWIFIPAVIWVLGKPEIYYALKISVWLIPSKALFSFVKTALQAGKEFFLDSAVDILSSVVRLLGFFILWRIGLSPLASALWSYILGLLLSTLIALPKVRELISVEADDKFNHKEFTVYQSWMTLAFVASSVSSRLDIFFLTRMVSLEMVGWYQAAFRLYMPVQQLASSISRVLAPRFASFSNRDESKIYLKKALFLSGGLAASMFLLIPVFPWAIKFLYGNNFQGSVVFAYWMMGYFSLFLFSTPWWSHLLYYHANAKKFALISILQLIVLAVAVPFSIASLGAAGVAIALFGSLALSTVLAAI